MDKDLEQRAAHIRLLVMDVDGVLTDGLLYNIVGPDGHVHETKGFSSQDGIALRWLANQGVQTGVISGRVSRAVEVRADQVGIRYVYQGHTDKLPILEEIMARSEISLAHIAYAGDDLTDIPCMRRVGLAFAPPGARPEVKRFAHHVTEAPAGFGCVREIVEILLRAQGLWQDVVKKYEAE
jgi:3-deoxy-D-manno-octulosonate 8-phosphate phosphatase (KDO 8-P phosphatase)